MLHGVPSHVTTVFRQPLKSASLTCRVQTTIKASEFYSLESNIEIIHYYYFKVLLLTLVKVINFVNANFKEQDIEQKITLQILSQSSGLPLLVKCNNKITKLWREEKFKA